MFQIGMDFEFAHLRTRRNRGAVAAVTLASISVPLALGILIGRASAAALAPGIDPVVYSLFCGVAWRSRPCRSSAHPARVRLTRAEVGVVAISAAALNDVIGWVMLAGVSAYAMARVFRAQLALQIAGLLVFVLVLWFVLRPLIGRLLAANPRARGQSAAEPDGRGHLPDVCHGHLYLPARDLRDLRRFRGRPAVPSVSELRERLAPAGRSCSCW